MEKPSHVLTGLMLALCGLLLTLGLLAGTVLYLQHPAFLAALLAAACLAGLLLFLRRRELLRPLLRLGEGRCALILCLLCLAVNGLWLLFVHLEPEGDYSVFWLTSRLLSRGERPTGDLNLYLSLFPHLLGYSSFLAPFLRLFGESTAVPVTLNLMLTGLSCLLLFRLCRDWWGLDTAALAALFWCFLPSKMLYNGMVLSEPLYTCLLLLFLRLMQLAERRRSLPLALLLGALSGLALRCMNMARPIAAVPVIAAGIWILLLRGEKLREKRDWLRWGGYFALLLGVYLLLAAPARGYLTEILGTEPAETPGYNIYVGFNPETDGGYSEADMATFGDVLHGPAEDDVNEAQRQMLALAIERAKTVKLPRLLLGKLRIFLGRDETAAYHSARALSPAVKKLCILACNVGYYLLGLLSLAGLWRLWKTREHSTALLVPLYCVGLTLAQMLAEVSDRYHYSLLPMLVLLAAVSGRTMKGERT